jgi:hypothetical protein
MLVEEQIVDKWLQLLQSPAAERIIENATEATDSVIVDLLAAAGRSVDRDLFRTAVHLERQVKRYSAKATIFSGRLKRVVRNVNKNRYPFFAKNVLEHPFGKKAVKVKMEGGEEKGQEMLEGVREEGVVPNPVTGLRRKRRGEAAVPYRVWTPEPMEW